MMFRFGGATEVEDDVDGVLRRVLFAAAISLSNNPLLPHLFAFADDDDASPLSVDWAPLELEFGPEVRH